MSIGRGKGGGGGGGVGIVDAVLAGWLVAWFSSVSIGWRVPCAASGALSSRRRLLSLRGVTTVTGQSWPFLFFPFLFFFTKVPFF